MPPTSPPASAAPSPARLASITLHSATMRLSESGSPSRVQSCCHVSGRRAGSAAGCDSSSEGASGGGAAEVDGDEDEDEESDMAKSRRR